MGMPAEIALFGDPKLRNFFLWGWRRKSSRRGLGMGKIFHPPPFEDAVSEN
jgi:hypothetical protein